MALNVPTAAQVIVAIVPIVGIVMAAVVIFFYLLWNHREKVKMIERGIYKPKRIDFDTFSLLAGILLTALGLVLTVLFVVLVGVNLSLFGGVIPLAAGLGLLVFFILNRSRLGK